MDIQDISNEKKMTFPIPKSVETFFTVRVSVSLSVRKLPHPGGYLLINPSHSQVFGIGEEI